MEKEYLEKCLSEVESKVNRTPKNAVPQRELSKQEFSFSKQKVLEQLKIWDYIWKNSSDHWVKIQAFLFCESQIKNNEFLTHSWKIIKHWQKKVDNWGQSDALSKIYTKILELIPDDVLRQLKRWNKSQNPWDRRQSVVSLLYFSRTKRVVLPYETIVVFINRLLNDKEYYVQKAVGWSLRELYNKYPEKTYKYFEENIKSISHISFAIATEKLSKKEKVRLKNLRK